MLNILRRMKVYKPYFKYDGTTDAPIEGIEIREWLKLTMEARWVEVVTNTITYLHASHTYYVYIHDG